MNDLISREALIDMLTKYKFGAIKSESEREYTKETVLNFVKEQSSATDTNVGGKWIPCSERLPEENRDGWTELLLSIKTGEVILGFWHDTETGFCRRFRDGVCSAGGVVAWMPLPEPYKGE